MAENIKFILNGCDIFFTAEAPEDITLKQLLEQTNKIFPDWCACGICSYERAGVEYPKVEILEGLYKMNYMEEFSFDPVASQRIASVARNNPCTLEHCADILETVAIICDKRGIPMHDAPSFLDEMFFEWKMQRGIYE